MEATIEGELVKLFDVRYIGSSGTFRVRDFVLRYRLNEKDQHRKLQAVGRAIDVLSENLIGTPMRAKVTLKGREFENKESGISYYNMDECHHLEIKKP